MLGDLRPLLGAKLLHEIHELLVFLCGPVTVLLVSLSSGPVFDLSPSVEALLVRPAIDALCDLHPISLSVLFDGLHKLVVFLFGPVGTASSGEPEVDHIVPAVPALLVGATFDVLCDSVPVAFAEFLHCSCQLVILFVRPRTLHDIWVKHNLPSLATKFL